MADLTWSEDAADKAVVSQPTNGAMRVPEAKAMEEWDLENALSFVRAIKEAVRDADGMWVEDSVLNLVRAEDDGPGGPAGQVFIHTNMNEHVQILYKPVLLF